MQKNPKIRFFLILCRTFHFLKNHTMRGVFFGVYGFFGAAPALHTPKKLECSPGHSNNFGAAPPECSLRSVVSNCLVRIVKFNYNIKKRINGCIKLIITYLLE